MQRSRPQSHKQRKRGAASVLGRRRLADRKPTATPDEELVQQTYLVCDRALRMNASSSGATGKRLNRLILEPPVLPVGTRPIAVFVSAPTIRKALPKHSRTCRCRQPQANMSQCTHTCCTVEACPKTWARSRWANACVASPCASARAASRSSLFT